MRFKERLSPGRRSAGEAAGSGGEAAVSHPGDPAPVVREGAPLNSRESRRRSSLLLEEDAALDSQLERRSRRPASQLQGQAGSLVMHWGACGR